jgi:putative mRNA 3-end processing factor
MKLAEPMESYDDQIEAMARISCRGAVLIGQELAVDGHEPYRYRVITHAHADHLVDINISIRDSPKILAHPATFELVEVLGISVPSDKAIKVNYGDKISLGRGTLRILRSRHILGSIQVLYTSDHGLSAAYTGDFKDPGRGTEIPESDVIITEATYGSPDYVRPYKDIVDELLADFVSEMLSRGPLIIKAYYGKQQEVMEILRNYGIDAPYIANTRVYRISKIAEKYGLRIGDIFLEGTREASEITRQGWYIYFTHTTRNTTISSKTHGYRHTIIYLSGWEKKLYRAIDNNTYIFSYSGHSDFEDLLFYIDNAKPRLVIVDAYRGGDKAKKFAKYVEEKLNIRTKYQPQNILCKDKLLI